LRLTIRIVVEILVLFSFRLARLLLLGQRRSFNGFRSGRLLLGLRTQLARRRVGRAECRPAVGQKSNHAGRYRLRRAVHLSSPCDSRYSLTRHLSQTGRRLRLRRHVGITGTLTQAGYICVWRYGRLRRPSRSIDHDGLPNDVGDLHAFHYLLQPSSAALIDREHSNLR
jgi:hypothetical protein